MTATTSTLTWATPTRRHRRVLRRLPARVAIAVLIVIEVYPLVWLLLGSFKSQREFLSEPFWALPSSLSWDNYTDVWTNGNLATYMRNSVMTVFPALALMITIGVAAAFALEVMVWKGRGTVLLIFLGGIMLPVQMILLPLFTIYFKAGLTGSLWPLIITYTAIGLPLTVFLTATYLRAIREMFEAASLDGASVYRQFRSIAMPLARNAIFTVGLVQFFFLWNDLLLALTFTSSDDLRTIQVGLLNFTGQYGAVDYGPTFAAICVNVFGTLALYLFLNKRVMRGLTAGSVKG